MSRSFSLDNHRSVASKPEAAAATVQVKYRNGDAEDCWIEICWLPNFELVNLSFYDSAANDLRYAADFDVQTAIKLRDELSKLIEMTTKAADSAHHANCGSSK